MDSQAYFIICYDNNKLSKMNLINKSVYINRKSVFGFRVRKNDAVPY